MKWSLAKLRLDQLRMLLKIWMVIGFALGVFWTWYANRHPHDGPWWIDVVGWGSVILYFGFFFKLCGIINNKECDEILCQQALEKQAAEKSTAERLPGEK